MKINTLFKILTISILGSVVQAQETNEKFTAGDKMFQKQGKKLKARNGKFKKFREQNPELFEELKEQRKVWKTLNKEDRAAARGAWFDSHPEAKVIMKKAKQGRKKFQDFLGKSNPELANKMQAQWDSWKGLTKEEIRSKRKEFFRDNPDLRSSLKKSQRSFFQERRLEKLRKKNPELANSLETKMSEWNQLPKKEFREKMREFAKAHPELKRHGKKGMKARFAKLKELDPELANTLKEKRQDWKELEPGARKEARKKFFQENPEIRERLKELRSQNRQG